jgi:hypothetical protein
VQSTVVELALPNGAVALVRAVDLDADEGAGATKASFGDRFDVDGIAETLQGLAEALRSAVAEARPDRLTITFGIELAVKSGRLTALLVEGAGKGSLSVTVEWDRARARPA